MEICWLVFGTTHNVFLNTPRFSEIFSNNCNWFEISNECEFFVMGMNEKKIHQITLGKFVHEQQQYSIIKECVGGIMSLGIRGWDIA